MTPRAFHPSVVLSSLMLACAVACDPGVTGDDEADTPAIARAAAGTVDGTDVWVGTVFEDDRVIAYFCGGDDTFDTHTRWFSGEPQDATQGTFSLEEDGWRVEGTADDRGVSGVLTEEDGTMRAFTTSAAGDDVAGLYSAKDGDCTAGVVVQDDGRAQGTYFCPDGVFVQVIILQPVALTAEGIEVQVDLPGGATTLWVEAV